MKIIFVTWWAISGLWKWITSSSIWKIMKSAWINVWMIKMDPYLQVDAWTMSPYEHWEVFVTDDWWETDLDLWNYERFTDENLTKNSNITTWKVYLNVINRERKWDYLWQTVQIIPHITNEIKEEILYTAKKYELTIVEVWGTVWDIESQPFLESIRQLKNDLWPNNVFFVHVAPLLYLNYSWETKTKLIQHSVIKLREYWIIPNLIVARSEIKIDKSVKDKISLMCWVPKENVIDAINVKSIYQVPEKFKSQQIDKILFKHFWLKDKKANLIKWNKRVDKIINYIDIVNIAVIWKYVEFEDTYKSINEALIHSWVENNVKINAIWLSSEDKEKLKQNLKELKEKKEIHWILIPWWFWKRWIEWKIYASKYARKNKIPYLGICLWMQVAVIDFARNECKLEDANSIEFDINCKNPVIDFMENQKKITKKWWTMRLWAYDTILKKWTLTYSLYNKKEISERHRHRYEVNINYHDILKDNWLVISWTSPDKKLVEFIELKDHPYFVATQAHPEFKSRLEKPHPLFVGLIKASKFYKV